MIQKPRGTQDIYNQEAKQWSALQDKLRNILAKFNYTEMFTPIFESMDLFVRSVGDSSDIVSKEMYELIDKKGRKFVLRPEGTASAVRAVIENKLFAPETIPFKTFYIGPMFRYERPQVGRYRQFHQLGLEVFGPDSIYQDIEVVNVANTIMKDLNLWDKTQINLNYLVTGEQRIEYIKVLKAYLSNFDLCSDCSLRLEKNALRVLDCKIDGNKFNDVPDMTDFLTKEDKVKYDILIEELKNMGMKIVVDKQLVRGLDYYTGFIFELKYLDESLGGQQTVIAGGRYNNLVSELGGPNLPAAGFAIGLERLIIILKENKNNLVENDQIDFYTIALSEKGMKLNLEVMNTLVENGYSIDTDYMNRSMKSAFKQAEKNNAKNVIILGDQEFDSRVITIKNLETKTSIEASIDQLIEKIKGDK
ncbi:histidine--tRNA ligase [Mesoplasma photuris]|uniref:histidine--tRNA ligase n=1 Tax=Mesoplasma photuris TaxID=217731 RepID=UPI0004E20EA9|nr:histidine--tRNA ligase [Mesoplasma photuris]